MLQGGRPTWFQPVATYPIVPATAIGKPMAAAVPMAWMTGTLHQTMNGTDRNAPPTAANADAALITVPAVKSPNAPGSERVGTGLRSSSRFTAAAYTTAANSAANANRGIHDATSDPSRPPKRMPGVMRFHMFQRTAPRAACERVLEAEVNRIVAIAVPTARWRRCSRGSS